MKYAIIGLTAILLAGCSNTTKPVQLERHVVKQVEYLVRIPPQELMTLPPLPPRINVETTTQADVAEWIKANEDYIDELTNKYIEVAKFLTTAQKEANETAEKENRCLLMEANRLDSESLQNTKK